MCHFAVHDKKEENTFLPLLKRNSEREAPTKLQRKREKREVLEVDTEKLVPPFHAELCGQKEQKKIPFEKRAQQGDKDLFSVWKCLT